MINVYDIAASTIGGIFTLLLLIVLASYVGALISAGANDEEDDK